MQVVDALTYIMEGKPCIRDFSPAKSDSVSSMPDSTESPLDNRSFNVDKAPTYGMGYASGKLPPSPSMKPTSSGTSSSGAQSAASGKTTSTKSGETFGDTNAESSYY